MKNPQAKYTGSCLCGEIRFEIIRFETPLGHCHCKMCQKFHGAAFSTFGEVRLENLHWISGQEKLKSFTASNKSIRQFCNNCGSSLLFCSIYNQQSGTIELAISTLDDAKDLKPDAHIYTSSKVTWITVNDDLPQFKQYRN
jgi:hypothetical protein